MRINWPKGSRPARAVLSAGIAAMILASAGALADDRSTESITTLDEVIVTAQKRTENIQSVPISVTAITERSLELLGASDQLGYFFTVPALSFQSQGPTGDQHGNVSLSLRGVAATSGANTVGFYINETPIHFVNPNLFDVDRIEVLRGPQGTLYGASSMGGTIKVITYEPTADHFDGKIDLSASHTEHGSSNVDGSVVFNIPLIEGRLAARIVGYSRDDSGYIDNIVRKTPQPPSTLGAAAAQFGQQRHRRGCEFGATARRPDRTQGHPDRRAVGHGHGHGSNLADRGDAVYKVIIDPTDPNLSYGTIAPLVNDFTHGSLLTHDINPAPQAEKFIAV